MEPERRTTETSGSCTSGRRKFSWKFRDRVASAPTRMTCPAPRATGQRFDQLVARREGPFGAVEGDPPGLGQGHRPSATFEQGMAKPRFQRPDLGRHRRLRHPQLLGGTREVSLGGDGAEGPKVGIVQQAHAFTLLERWGGRKSQMTKGAMRRVPPVRTRFSPHRGLDGFQRRIECPIPREPGLQPVRFGRPRRKPLSHGRLAHHLRRAAAA